MLNSNEISKYTVNKDSFAEGKKLINCIYATYKKVLKSLTCAQNYQARNYNKSHCKIEYKVGQKFWLRVKNITVERLLKKLDWQHYRPYQIIERIEKIAYCLDLPQNLKIHSDFHVNLLHDHKSRTGEDSPEPQ